MALTTCRKSRRGHPWHSAPGRLLCLCQSVCPWRGGYWQRWVTMPDLVAGLCEAIPPVPPVGVLFGEIEAHGRLPVVLGI